MSDPATKAPAPWLTLVGVGADGLEGLGADARRALERAEVVFGSARQLALIAPVVHGETAPWPSPFADGLARVLARRGRPTCVVASGDPFWFGVGATLARHLERGELVCHPAPSSLSLAAARLAWPLQDTEVLSLHGRDLHGLVRHLHPGRRLLALSWDEHTPRAVARLLTERGFGPSRVSVLEALGGPEERVRTCRARDFALDDVQVLNLVALELEAEPGVLGSPCRASLPDDAFSHDGQLTKHDVRALTLSALAPRPGARLWDVGAGSGSIAIEWLLSHPACRAIAVERDAARAARIVENARRLGVPELELVHGAAPAALEGLPAPDAVFIGGGACRELIDVCARALGAGGRLVMNAVTLETEVLLLAAHAERGGELRRFSIEVAAPLGGKLAWRPALPITQWRLCK